MNNEILFFEKQKLPQWWLWSFIIIANGLFVFGILRQIMGRQQFDKPTDKFVLFIIERFIISLSILFINFRLETKINTTGILVRFFPFHISYKYYSWDKISKSFVRQYNPILEYGGWGLKFGLFGSGRALNMSGDKGSQLEFTNNKKLLIGTNKPDGLADILKKIGQFKQ